MSDLAFRLELTRHPSAISARLTALVGERVLVVRPDGLQPPKLPPGVGEAMEAAAGSLERLSTGPGSSGEDFLLPSLGPRDLALLPPDWEIAGDGVPQPPPRMTMEAAIQGRSLLWSLASAGTASDYLAARHTELQGWIAKGGLALVRSKEISRKEDLERLRALCVTLPAAQPEGFVGTLRDYQRAGLAWLKFLHNAEKGGVLGDGMGVGKSAQTISLLCDLKTSAPRLKVLIAAPTSVVPNWAAEFRKFAPEISTHVWHGSKRRAYEKAMRSAEVIITSYALLRGDESLWGDLDLDYVILDEAQTIKNHKSSIAIAAKKIPARHRLALTGTPVENRLAELWSIFDFASPGLLDSLPSFTKQYAVPIGNGDKKAAAALRRVIHPFLLRRTKEDVVKELPSKVETDLLVEMGEVQQKIYNQVLADVRRDVMGEIDKHGVEKSQMHILAGMVRLRQAAADPRLVEQGRAVSASESGKLQALRQIIDECQEGGEKLLVFSQFTSLLKHVRKSLDQDDIGYEYLDGETKDRGDIVQRFQEPGGKPVFLLSLKAGGTGLNLTAASVCVLFDPWFNPAVEDQATARAHRMGQKKSVNVYRLIALGTIEEKILLQKGRKRELADAVLNADAGGVKSLTRQDIEDLLS